MEVSIPSWSPIGVDKLLVDHLKQDFPETTVLVRAVRAGTIQETKVLLERGCNPNTPCGVQRIRPLMFACHLPNTKKRARILNLLLDHGADPALKDSGGRNSLMYACALCDYECVHSMLLNHDMDLNDIDHEGNTLLHICAMAGDHSILSRVLQEAMKFKIEISLRNDYSLTPLSVAVFKCNWMCVDVLYNIGARPRLPLLDESNFTECLKEPSQTLLNDIMRVVIKDMKANALCAFASEHGYGVSQSRSTSPSNECVWVNSVRFGHHTRRQSLSAHARLLPTRSRTVPNSRQAAAVYHFGETMQEVKEGDCKTLPRIRSNRSSFCSSSRSHDFQSILARLFVVQKTSLFCKPCPMAKIDQQWIEVIEKYSVYESTDGDESSTKSLPPVLTRTLSSPYGTKNNNNNNNNPSARTRKLGRCTTSPLFNFSVLNRQSSKTVVQ